MVEINKHHECSFIGFSGFLDAEKEFGLQAK